MPHMRCMHTRGMWTGPLHTKQACRTHTHSGRRLLHTQPWMMCRAHHASSTAPCRGQPRKRAFHTRAAQGAGSATPPSPLPPSPLATSGCSCRRCRPRRQCWASRAASRRSRPTRGGCPRQPEGPAPPRSRHAQQREGGRQRGGGDVSVGSVRGVRAMRVVSRQERAGTARDTAAAAAAVGEPGRAPAPAPAQPTHKAMTGHIRLPTTPETAPGSRC